MFLKATKLFLGTCREIISLTVDVNMLNSQLIGVFYLFIFLQGHLQNLVSKEACSLTQNFQDETALDQNNYGKLFWKW